MKEIYNHLHDVLQSGHSAALVSRYSDKEIEKHIVSEDTDEWNGIFRSGEAVVFQSENESEANLIEYYYPRPRFIILGGGHIALSLSKMSSLIDFDVFVYDDRPSFASRDRFPEATGVFCESFEDLTDHITFRKTDYVVIVTRGHQYDTHCLRAVLTGDEVPTYVGMIGSSRRVAIVKKQLVEEGIPQSKMDQVHSPIGLKIGSVTPAEISISILAEVVSCRRLGPNNEKKQAIESADLELVEYLSASPSDDTHAVITIVETKGSTPRDIGAKMVVTYDGRTIGTIGGGCAESDVITDARLVIRNGGYLLKTVDLTDSADEDGMVCGGTMKVLIESYN